MVMSALARIIWALSMRVRQNGQRRYISCKVARSPDFESRYSPTALPRPYQPGSVWRDCIQLKTQGMARSWSTLVDVPRRDCREPIMNWDMLAVGGARSE